MKAKYKFNAYQVNAFCTADLIGNPAGVCIVNEKASNDTHWMQEITSQFGFSETAFLCRESATRYGIRWFSPKREMFLCGHPTLASAHILFELDIVKGNSIEFLNPKGIVLAIRVERDIELDFPANVCEPAPLPSWFEQAFKITPVDFLQGPNKYLAVVPDEEDVLMLNPDFELLRRVADRGVIVSSKSSTVPYDIVSRYFAAYAGIDEDPVTGAAHCCLGPYWSPRLGKQEIFALQASANGGALRVQSIGNRVYLTGTSRTMNSRKILWTNSAARS